MASCKPKEEKIPADVMPPDSMISILADLHLAEAKMVMGGMEARNSDIKSVYLKSVLANAKVDTAYFSKSFNYYSIRPELFSQMYEKVIEELSKRQAKN